MPSLGTPAERAPLLALAQRMHRTIAKALGHDAPQPLLARLLYEAVFEERATRRFHAIWMLRAVPYRAHIADANSRLARNHTGPHVRSAATQALMHLGRTRSPDDLLEFVRAPDAATQRAGLIAGAHCQISLDGEALAPFVDVGHPLWNKALYAAAATACPEIAALARLVRDFAQLLAPPPGNDTALSNWIANVCAADLPYLHVFVNGLDLIAPPLMPDSPARTTTAAPKALIHAPRKS